MINPQAFIFGFSQGFVIGPISLFAIREGLDPKRGFWYQVQVYMGATVVDIIYLLLASYGAAQFIENSYVKFFMWAAAAYMLISMGYNSLRQKPKRLSLQHMHRHRHHFYETDFFRALLINLVNPLAVIFWILVAGGLYAEYAATVSPFMFAMNIVMGGTISSLLVTLLTLVVRQVFHQWMIKKLIQVGSIVLIIYGLYFSFKALLELQPLVIGLLAL